jgi:hypothetical protein
MDDDKVVEIIAKERESDEERARQYLQKLINITVPVPEIDPRKSVIS